MFVAKSLLRLFPILIPLPFFFCDGHATAPTLALNGPRGSMHTAVKGMYEERTMIWNAFTIGAMAFSIDMLIFIWIILSQNGVSKSFIRTPPPP